MTQQRIHMTVAAIVARADKFLCVEESVGDQTVINQPAGHVEAGESLLEAVVRETLEETGWRVLPTWFLGIGIYRSPQNGITYYRHNFVCEPLDQDTTGALDPEIQRVLWLSVAELEGMASQMRSPMVLQAINDYQAGQRFPLEIIRDYR